MECNKCKTRMTEGILGANGQSWVDKARFSKLGLWMINPTRKNGITAWKCEVCGRVELFVEKKL